jgi:hypothetical protein
VQELLRAGMLLRQQLRQLSQQQQEAQLHQSQQVQAFTQHTINLLGSSSSSHRLKLWHSSCSLSTWQLTGMQQQKTAATAAALAAASLLP